MGLDRGTTKEMGRSLKTCGQLDGLSMTFASGMDMLKNLRELTRVAFGGIPAGFDNEAEKAWREEHWPGVASNLRDIHPLEDPCWSAIFDLLKDWRSI